MPCRGVERRRAVRPAVLVTHWGQALTDGGAARRREWFAALVLKRALQTIVEVLRRQQQLVEGFLWRQRAGQHGEQADATKTLRVDGGHGEGAGLGETRRAQHRALIRARFVEDVE